MPWGIKLHSDFLKSAQRVFDLEIDALQSAKDSLGPIFCDFVEAIDTCQGHIIFMGIGKSGHICEKIVATMQSLGIKSYFLHPAEALHGDLGIISQKDMIIAVSNSGETSEILNTIPSISKIGASLYSIIGRSNSTLQKESVKSLILPTVKEAFLGSLVPSSSTTMTLALGDALAIAIAEHRNFTKNDFGIYHPNGLLGKKLTLKISDIMLSGDDNSYVLSGSTIQQTLYEMCKKPAGGVSIVDANQHLMGVFTDGDLRRLFNKSIPKVMELIVDDFMTKSPISLSKNDLAHNAILNTVSNHNVSFFPVVDDDNHCVGTVRMIDFIKSGLMG